jgi:hypothetical protein
MCIDPLMSGAYRVELRPGLAFAPVEGSDVATAANYT